MNIKRFFVFAVPLLLTLVAIQFTVLTVLGVREKMKSVNEQLDAKLLAVDNQEADSAYTESYRRKLWLETRLQISRTDHISLSVNLKDSLLQLELKGVVIKTSKILYFEADQFFSQLSPGAYYHLFAAQARVDTCFSTIARQPVTIKKAPKDTSAVENTVMEIDTTKTEAVHWMMKLDNDIVFKIEGSDQYARGDWWIGQQFWLKQDLAEIGRGLKQTLLFRKPEYFPEIRIVVSETDAKAIYRALPENHLICVRL